METETPDGLHRMQYATHILEEVLCWPSKGNAELLADCILSLSRGKKLSIKQAHDYIVRAVKLAKEQGIEVNRFWFQGGEYTNVRPERKAFKGSYDPVDVEALRREQETPEWQQASQELRAKLAKLAGKTFESERLLQQRGKP